MTQVLTRYTCTEVYKQIEKYKPGQIICRQKERMEKSDAESFKEIRGEQQTDL